MKIEKRYETLCYEKLSLNLQLNSKKIILKMELLHKEIVAHIRD